MNASACVQLWQKELKDTGTADRERQRAGTLLNGDLAALKLLKQSMGSRAQLETNFYVSSSAADQISVRVRGAVIGTVALSYGMPKFTGGGLEEQNWNSKQVLKLIQSHLKKTSLVEKNIEARILTILESKGVRLQGHPLRNHAAVKFPPGSGGLRIQFPNPSAPRGGSAVGGHVDILTRKGRGRGSILRVLELKKPGAAEGVHKTLEQAIAYCVGIVEAGCPAIWKLYGYSKGTPPIALEATAVVFKTAKCGLEACQKVLSEMGSTKIGDFPLSLSILLYTLDAKGKLSLEEVPNPDPRTPL